MFNVSDVNTACDAKGITRMLKYKRGEEKRNHSLTFRVLRETTESGDWKHLGLHLNA